jgi:hypothetical protein
MFHDLITSRPPPANRIAKTEGDFELHFTEAAVMLAFAFHLLENDSNLQVVELHPDGEHGKQFDIRSWLEGRDYNLIKPEGTTSYGGLYSNGERSGDVVAETEAGKIVAECKGGIINTKHPGQKSRLRRGLCEAVGLLMTRPLEGERQFAVVPKTNDTEIVAKRMSARSNAAGIGILLVEDDGTVSKVSV